MRFIFWLFLSLFVVLRAEDDVDLIDLHLLLKQINQINQVIRRYQADPNRRSEISLYNDQKNDLIHTFALKLLNNQEHIGFNIKENTKQQKKLKEALLKNSDKDIYTYVLDTLRLKNLELDADMYYFLEKLRTSLDFFSQEKDVKSISTSYLLKLEGYAAKTYVAPSNLDDFKHHNFQETLDNYQIKLKTYIEVLHYIQKHPSQVLSKNVVLSINLKWILERISHLIAQVFPKANGLQSAKIVLSLVLLVVLLALRQLITALFVKALDYVVRFTRKNAAVQQKIRNSIIAPISTFLFIYSFDVSIDILYYPHPTPPKFAMYLGVVYILLFAWLFIALFKAYGAALLANLASKSNGLRKEVINLILKIAYFFIFVITILWVLKQLGFDISTIIASLGIGGLAVALAVKDVLANFFASVILLLDNSFSQGDWIVCGDVEGTVVEMGLRRTTVRGFDNALLFVPNSELAGKSIRNWNRRKVGRRIKMTIGLTYSSSREALQKCVLGIRTMLEQHPHIAKASDMDSASEQRLHDDHHALIMGRQDIVSVDDLMGYKSNLFVYLDSFGDSSINIFIYCFSKTVVWGEWLAVKEDVILQIMKVVEECGLSFAFPSQSVYVESLPKDKSSLS
ncbi:Potassium efflux system protein/Small-conductance mechanosensitive channel [Helicobacter bizzozeronii]|uniref:mechanosensitive ion channel family protein n=1 Tax=Helicobacter bizzozeronii TaxID=56877 RepID=UPI00244D8F10|nr:mechanosensitive ion channel domain-containing protein [Helicobacter bizzozeronii]GMB92597.1 Potassium efflux system protein/Small-conductance mechanosensitive channel [Helicobacter bizzozeronii]